MLAKFCIDWLVRLKVRVRGYGTSDHNPQVPALPWHTGYSVVGQYHSIACQYF
jgi:hypothetical protein